MRFLVLFLSVMLFTEKYGYADSQISVDGSKAVALVEKAKGAYADQRHVEGQELFLEALCACELQQETPISIEEQKIIDSLMPLYASSSQSQNDSQRLVAEVDTLRKNHKDFFSLEFFKASAYANSGDFLSFFDSFFAAHTQHPDFFLSLKIRGVLHLRLFEESSAEDKRIWHRNQAVAFFQKAFSKRPSDASLLVKLVFLLPDEDKKKLLESVSDDISRIEIPLQRGECMYLIQQAIELNSPEVAKKLIEKAHMWYQYSRKLQELEAKVCD